MDNSLKYLIVDDDDIDRLAIETQAEKFPFFHKIAACTHPVEAFELIRQCRPDVVFADIEMPGMNGLDLIRCLSGDVPAPVFITSHPDFALEGYEMEAFDYILKPLDPVRFARCATRLYDFFELRVKAGVFDKVHASDYIVVKEGYDRNKVLLQDILYLEAMKDYTRIVTTSRAYLVLGTLTGMYEKLPSEKFTRIHRSFIVHRDKVRAVQGNKVQVGDILLPVGKLYKHMTAAFL